MDADDEDFIFYGTPIEREEELTSRKRKAAAEAAGNLRSLPPWKQEVTDEEGRRRFHGAFTGGFSAGYYNSVGSKEGWTPQSFKSSRKNRAEVKAQSLYSFLDEDEKAEFEGHLGTSMQFDTFGFTAAELARSQAEKEQNERPSAIPGPIPDELVVPAVNSIGLSLCEVATEDGMEAWTLNQGFTFQVIVCPLLIDSRREARKAFLALSHDDDRPQLADSERDKSESETVTEWSAAADDFVLHTPQSTPAFVLNPKQEMHGLGYDPFKHAPEFRGKVAPGFGIGAMEELDVEDEDIYASGFEFEEVYVDEDEEPSRLNKDIKQLLGKKEGVLSGFKVASDSEYQLERFNPPAVPPNFQPYHKFSGPLETENKLSLSDPPPPEVSPPENNNLRLLIEGFATLVTRCGKLFEDLSREKNKNNPLFSFLTGGVGHDFYARKLWEERQKHANRQKLQIDVKYTASAEKMTAESRGIILGERPLERSSNESVSSSVSTDVVQLQYNLSDTFTKPASLVESLQAAKPFKGDPAKQARFEQFLKDRYLGGLRSTYSTGNTSISEDDRARERLDFEAAAEAIEKGLQGKSGDLPSNQQFMELLAAGKGQFVSAGIEQNKVPQNEEKEKKRFPRREEYQWRPFPLLCRRFDILDPFLGKPPPVSRPRTKMDTLIFMPDLVKPTKPEEGPAVTAKDPSSISRSDELEHVTQVTGKETDMEVDNANLQRPVDLYKAIFSDESDDEEENNVNQNDDAEKKTVVSSTLNRMIAGDFLESLGKELGLEVPTSSLFSIDKSKPSTSGKEAVKIDDSRISSGNDRSIPAVKVADKHKERKGATDHEAIIPDLAKQDASSNQFEKGREKSIASTYGNGLNDDASQNKATTVPSWANATDVGHLEHDVSKSKMQNKVSDDKKPLRIETDDKRRRKHSRQYQSSSSSSSSDYDSSDDDKKYQDRSRSKQEKRESSRRKRRKHSKRRHSHKSKRSPDSTSHHGSSRDHKEERREKSRSRDKERAHGSSNSEAHRKYH
ncbi:hypothetical protein ACLOJK_032435 [Asimina triloba]